ncbi:unnamed protein product [Periconia digitata]|uniref:Uncharacterized protein n=1 Tax=Periconia digitata TaxID=1303443 RepID=A0A9W4XPJ1_9PLEO|nr:unnamed protein product [Periconia digitata]
MPKGKSKAKNPDLYEDEDATEAEERSKAPQAAVHARGGRWEVRDDLKTGTHWDDMHHIDLKRATEEAGVHKKDMSKIEMIHALAKKDRIDEMERKAAEKEEQRKKRLVEIQERKKHAERLWRKRDRQARRSRGEDYVSDTTDSGSDSLGRGSDDESNMSTTTTPSESSITSVNPAPRLRIYEWPYGDAPPANPPQAPMSSSDASMNDIQPEPLPKRLPYAVMKIMTTVSKEKLELPGRQYSEEVGPDFVLSLSEHTKDCARNGIMYGQLQRAVIERATDWARRTQVQWWNGIMCFNLPPRGSSRKVLADVYAKWNRNKKKLHRREGLRGGGIHKAEPKQIATQRLKDQRQKMIDVYAVSEHRPSICYMPSYLDYPFMEEDEEVAARLDNLFYIRFVDMDLPHYYFWSTSEWNDPTKPNPDWLDANNQNVRLNSLSINPVLNETGNKLTPSSRNIRVKKTLVPRKFRSSSIAPKTSRYKAAIWAFEKDLYNKGLAVTLKDVRERWNRDGKKTREWRRLVKNLPSLYPAGELPASPPVSTPPGITSLAEKFAGIEVPSEQRWPIESIIGDEPWTRDDEAYWDIAQIPLIASDTLHDTLHALERRGSEDLPFVTAWMNKISTSPDSPSLPAKRRSSTTPPVSLDIRQRERAVWEESFLQNIESETVLSSTIEQMPVAELKHNLYLMMQRTQLSPLWHHHDHGNGLLQRQCKVCLHNLGSRRRSSIRRHYHDHQNKANDRCPFYGAEWNKWPSEVKASHIFIHGPLHDQEQAEGAGRQRRLQSRPVSDGVNALYAIPRTGTRRSSTRGSTERELNTDNAHRFQSGGERRRLSKVSFSPVTVEKRVAYNDFGDSHSYDADASSITTPSPKRSILRSNPIKDSFKSALKIDMTASPLNSRQRRGPIRIDRAKHLNQQPPNTKYLEDPWNPEGYSSSEPVLSPSPHAFTNLLEDHPDATWDPRRASKSSVESLEFLNAHPASRSSAKRKSRRDIALAASKSAAATTLGSRRAAKKEPEIKTAILGKPYVPPLVIAPAKQWAKKASQSHHPTASAERGGLSDFLSPSTPEVSAPAFFSQDLNPGDSKSSDDQLTDYLRRGRRSSAPTPSPSLTSSHPRTASDSTQNSSISPTLIHDVFPIAQIQVQQSNTAESAKRKHSFDVPYSQPSLIVPPNTPANRPKARRKKRQ